MQSNAAPSRGFQDVLRTHLSGEEDKKPSTWWESNPRPLYRCATTSALFRVPRTSNNLVTGRSV